MSSNRSKSDRKKPHSSRSQQRNSTSSCSDEAKYDFESKRRDRRSGKYNTISSRPGGRGLDYESNDFLGDYKTSRSKYAGIQNGGSTCYMNSVLQQLYHTPGISQDILMASPSTNPRSIFCQIQQVFGTLDDQKPPQMASFWRAFKLWGESINTYEQQDAYEFFVDLISQLDDHMTETNQSEVFKPRFQGVYSDIKDCQGCHHSYESQEQFLAVSLTVKPEKSLEEALDQFVKGVRLEGDNAYLCDKCGVKRDATKTMCIKTLPPVLVIHLRRIKMDWETGRATKFNDYFKFPQLLNMEPYTVKGIQSRAKSKPSDKSSRYKGVKRGASTLCPNNSLYQLVGVVVHTGQANSGHYYSLIRDRHGTAQINSTRGTWYKFNDTSVREYKMTETALEEECFGGNHKPNKNSWYNHFPSFSSSGHERSNSGYMLFYEKVDAADLEADMLTEGYENTELETRTKKMHTTSSTLLSDLSETTPASDYIGSQVSNTAGDNKLQLTAPDLSSEVNPTTEHTKPKVTTAHETKSKENSSSNKWENKTTSHLLSRTSTTLTTHGDKGPPGATQHLMADKGPGVAQQVVEDQEVSSEGTPVDLPPAVQEALRYENMQIKRVRYHLFSYKFDFLRALRAHEMIPKNKSVYEPNDEKVKLSIEHAIKLLPYNFGNNVSRVDTHRLDEWCAYIKHLLKYSKEASTWAIQFLGNQDNYRYLPYYLVQHQNATIREFYSKLILSILQSYVVQTSSMSFYRSVHLGKALEVILSLLSEKIPAHTQTCGEYFGMMKEYLLGSKESFTYIQQMLQKGAFESLIIFMIGSAELVQETDQRRWTTAEAKHFAPLVHTMLAKMITNCDISSLRPSELQNIPHPNRQKPPLNMPDDMRRVLGGLQCFTYIKESLRAVCEYPKIITDIIDMLMNCCYCNHDISVSVLTEIFENIDMCLNVDLKHLTHVLLEILLIDDPLKDKRLDMALKELNKLMCIHCNHSDSMKFNSLVDFVSLLIDQCPQLKHLDEDWKEVASSLRSKHVSDKKLTKAMSMLSISNGGQHENGSKQCLPQTSPESSRHSRTNSSASYQSNTGTFYSAYT
ncbi:ubiquitin carboxyl-terminal hydrolase 24-like [Amphiura filiformis]|uniref:ubiquitin carboxyl-terminal hydrolase 24-like n=1 Tax=Amphiura filiformis TaxID=82378 RepID=UPI003B227439